MKECQVVSGVRIGTGAHGRKIRTPRRNISPRFVQAPQPQNTNYSPGRCLSDTSPDEYALAGGQFSIDKDECGAINLMVSQEEPCSGKLLKPLIQEILVNWLNAELKDRLDSIDRKLGLLQRTRVTTHSTGIQDTLRRSAHEWEVDQGVPSPIGSRDSPPHVASQLSDGARKDMSHVRATIQIMLKNRQKNHGRLSAAAWRFFEDRSSGLLAYLWSLVMPGLVFISIGFSFWQTVDGCPLPRTAGDILQALCEVVFAVELLLRFIVSPDRRRFVRTPLNTIDLLTCLPLVLRVVAAIVGLTGARFDVENVLSELILLPALRLLKLTRRFEQFQLLLSAFLIAMEALPVLLYTMLAMALVFSSLLYAVEPRDNILNLPHAMWFVLVTMTTCGYGDVTPSTLPGKLIASTLMVASILYMAMPIGIVGNAFSTAWDARDRLLLMERIREAFLYQGFNETALREIVTTLVGDCDTELGFAEFHAVLQSVDININADRAFMLLASLDKSGNGKVNVDELLSGLFPHDYAEYFNNLSYSASLSQQGSLNKIQSFRP